MIRAGISAPLRRSIAPPLLSSLCTCSHPSTRRPIAAVCSPAWRAIIPHNQLSTAPERATRPQHCVAPAAQDNAPAPMRESLAGTHHGGRARRARHIYGFSAPVWALLHIVFDLLALPQASEALDLDARLRARGM
jgi:hypothetical protein